MKEGTSRGCEGVKNTSKDTPTKSPGIEVRVRVDSGSKGRGVRTTYGLVCVLEVRSLLCDRGGGLDETDESDKD